MGIGEGNMNEETVINKSCKELDIEIPIEKEFVIETIDNFEKLPLIEQFTIIAKGILIDHLAKE